MDDLLLSLLHSRAPQQLALVVAYLSLVGAPISWKKAAFGPSITWCGWQFCFRTETVCLAQPKLDKLRAQLLHLLQHKRVPRNDASCKIVRDASYLQLPLQARVIEVRGKPVRAKTDIWPIPAADKTIWVRIADPSASEITLRNESKAAIHWLAQCFAYEFTMPLARQPLLPCLSAADAMADGTTVGIGGWLATSSTTWWFAQQWDIQELRTAWPFLTKDAQRYIACFETVAQWVLLQMAYEATGCSSLRFCVASRSDNSPTQASINKLFTTAFPLSFFLEKVASWAHARGLELEIGHIRTPMRMISAATAYRSFHALAALTDSRCTFRTCTSRPTRSP